MKNTKATMKWFCILTIAGVLTIYSCKKETTPTPTPTPTPTTTFTTESSEDQALTDNSSDDMSSMADEAVDGNLTSYKNGESLLGGCATRSGDTAFSATFPKTIYINFGDGTCKYLDGRYRKGSIMITVTGPMRYPGSVMTITTIDYYVSVKDTASKMHQIIGTKVITNGGKISFTLNGVTMDVIKFTSSVDSGRIIRANGGQITWSNSRTKLIKLDSTILYHGDDLIINYGTGNGVNANGASYTNVVAETNPLVRKWADCRYFVSGVVNLTITKNSEVEKFMIDYAGETPITCNQALVTWAGQDDDFSATADNKTKAIYLFR